MKDLGIVIDELGVKWEDLTRNQKAYLATAIAGNRQSSRFYALMNDYDRTLELVAEGTNSAGSAQRQYLLYSDSLEASQKRLTNQTEKFFNSLTKGNGILSNSLDLLTGIMKVINLIGPIPAIVGAFAFGKQAKEGFQNFKDLTSNKNADKRDEYVNKYRDITNKYGANGKAPKRGTEEYKQYKKEMDNFNKNLSKEEKAYYESLAKHGDGNNILDKTTNKYNKAKDWFKNKNAKEKWTDIKNITKQGADKVESLGEKAKEVVTSFNTYINSAGNSYVNSNKTVLNSIKEAAQNLANKGKELAQSTKEKVGGVKKTLSGKWTDFKNKINQNETWNKLKNKFSKGRVYEAPIEKVEASEILDKDNNVIWTNETGLVPKQSQENLPDQPKNEQKEQQKQIENTNEAQQKLLGTAEQFTTKTPQQGSTYWSGFLSKLKLGITSVGTAIKSALKSIVWAWAIAKALEVAMKGINAIVDSLNGANESKKAEELENRASTLEGLKTRYIELASATNRTIEEERELIDVENQLKKADGDLADVLNDTSKGYLERAAAIDKEIESAKKMAAYQRSISNIKSTNLSQFNIFGNIGKLATNFAAKGWLGLDNIIDYQSTIDNGKTLWREQASELATANGLNAKETNVLNSYLENRIAGLDSGFTGYEQNLRKITGEMNNVITSIESLSTHQWSIYNKLTEDLKNDTSIEDYVKEVEKYAGQLPDQIQSVLFTTLNNYSNNINGLRQKMDMTDVDSIAAFNSMKNSTFEYISDLDLSSLDNNQIEDFWNWLGLIVKDNKLRDELERAISNDTLPDFIKSLNDAGKACGEFETILLNLPDAASLLKSLGSLNETYLKQQDEFEKYLANGYSQTDIIGKIADGTLDAKYVSVNSTGQLVANVGTKLITEINKTRTEMSRAAIKISQSYAQDREIAVEGKKDPLGGFTKEIIKDLENQSTTQINKQMTRAVKWPSHKWDEVNVAVAQEKAINETIKNLKDKLKTEALSSDERDALKDQIKELEEGSGATFNYTYDQIDKEKLKGKDVSYKKNDETDIYELYLDNEKYTAENDDRILKLKTAYEDFEKTKREIDENDKITEEERTKRIQKTEDTLIESITNLGITGIETVDDISERLNEQDQEWTKIINDSFSLEKQFAQIGSALNQYDDITWMGGLIDEFAQINQYSKTTLAAYKNIYSLAEKVEQGGKINIFDMADLAGSNPQLLGKIAKITDNFNNFSKESVNAIFKEEMKAEAAKIKAKIVVAQKQKQILEEQLQLVKNGDKEAIESNAIRLYQELTGAEENIEALGDVADATGVLGQNYYNLGNAAKDAAIVADTAWSIAAYNLRHGYLVTKDITKEVKNLSSYAGNTKINVNSEEFLDDFRHAMTGFSEDEDFQDILSASMDELVAIGLENQIEEYNNVISGYQAAYDGLINASLEASDILSGSSSEAGNAGSGADLEKFYKWLKAIEQLERKISQIDANRNLFLTANDRMHTTSLLQKEVDLTREKYKIEQDLLKQQRAYLITERQKLASTYNWLKFTEDGMLYWEEGTTMSQEVQESLEDYIEQFEAYQDRVADNTNTWNDALEKVKEMYDEIGKDMEDISDNMDRIIARANSLIGTSLKTDVVSRGFGNITSALASEGEAANRELTFFEGKREDVIQKIRNADNWKWAADYIAFNGNENRWEVTKAGEEAAAQNAAVKEWISTIITADSEAANWIEQSKEKLLSLKESLTNALESYSNYIINIVEGTFNVTDRLIGAIERDIENIDYSINMAGWTEDLSDDKFSLLIKEEKELNAIVKGTNDTLKARKKVIKDSLNKMGIDIKDLKLYTDSQGRVIYNEEVLRTELKDKNGEYQWMIKELDTYNKLIDENVEAESKLNEVNQKKIEIAKQYREDTVKGLNEISKALKGADEYELKQLKAKYDEMKSLDDEYYSSLEKKVQKQRDARNKEQKVTDISQLQSRIAVLQRDGSGAYSSQLADLQKQLRDSLQNKADEDVDDELKRIKEEQEDRQKQREIEEKQLENLIKFKEENGIYLDETRKAFAAGFATVSAILLGEYQRNNMSEEEQQEQLDDMTDTLMKGVAYAADKTFAKEDSIENFLEKVSDDNSAIKVVSEDIVEAMNTDLTNFTDGVKMSDIAAQLTAIEEALEIQEIIDQMQFNSTAWWSTTDADARQALQDANDELMETLKTDYGLESERGKDGITSIWRKNKDGSETMIGHILGNKYGNGIDAEVSILDNLLTSTQAIEKAITGTTSENNSSSKISSSSSNESLRSSTKESTPLKVSTRSLDDQIGLAGDTYRMSRGDIETALKEAIYEYKPDSYKEINAQGQWDGLTLGTMLNVLGWDVREQSGGGALFYSQSSNSEIGEVFLSNLLTRAKAPNNATTTTTTTSNKTSNLVDPTKYYGVTEDQIKGAVGYAYCNWFKPGASLTEIKGKTWRQVAQMMGWTVYTSGKIKRSDGEELISQFFKKYGGYVDSADGLTAKKWNGYSTGGLVDYTGLAMVHGKPGNPEAFLNAKQTELFAQLRDGLVANSYKYSGKDAEELAGDTININGIEIAVKELAEIDDVNKIVNTIKQSIYKDATSGKSLKLNRR